MGTDIDAQAINVDFVSKLEWICVCCFCVAAVV